MCHILIYYYYNYIYNNVKYFKNHLFYYFIMYNQQWCAKEEISVTKNEEE